MATCGCSGHQSQLSSQPIASNNCQSRENLQMTTDPGDTRPQPPERTQEKTNQLSPAKPQNSEELRNYCLKVLNFVVVCYMAIDNYNSSTFFFLPCKFDAKCCPGLCSSSLLNVAGSFHHIFYRPVVIEVKLMHHIFSILHNSNLQGRGEGNETF